MDAIDNLIYSTLNPCVYPSGFLSNQIQSEFEILGIAEPAAVFTDQIGSINIVGGTRPSNFNAATGITSYQQATRLRFVTLDHSGVLEDAIRKHWFDISNRIFYSNTAIGGQVDQTGVTFPIFSPLNSRLASPPATEAYVKFNIPPYHLIFSYLVENTRIVQIFERLIGMYVHDEK